MLKQVVYTNSNCSDIWGMFVEQNKKHTNIDLLVICDTKEFPIKDKENIFQYSNNDNYHNVWVEALNFFGIENFIYLQEDFILYNNANDSKIEFLTNELNNSNYSFIRLIKSGSLNNKLYKENLFEIEPCNYDVFSMQSTIWKTKDYVNIMNNVKEPKWLETPNYKNFMCLQNISGLYYYDNEKKRGENHYDSSIYPYIATALVRGKWNITEYEEDLSGLIKNYNININERGVF